MPSRTARAACHHLNRLRRVAFSGSGTERYSPTGCQYRRGPASAVWDEGPIAPSRDSFDIWTGRRPGLYHVRSLRSTQTGRIPPPIHRSAGPDRDARRAHERSRVTAESARTALTRDPASPSGWRVAATALVVCAAYYVG